VLRMNHAFKGVVVDRAGTHRIEFATRPESLALSLTLAALGLTGLAGGAWLSIRRK
jgi:hypothetical protein